MSSSFFRLLIPMLVGIGALLFWEAAVTIGDVPKFVLPAPSVIGAALLENFGSLMSALWVTLRITLLAFALAVVGGVALAILFSQSRLIEMALFPYAIILQVTPVVAIAPLILIWVGFDNVNLALLILAWIVAFFPILSNTTLGLRSVDHNLMDLFTLYGATRWQRLWSLQLPAALPYILALPGGLLRRATGFRCPPCSLPSSCCRFWGSPSSLRSPCWNIWRCVVGTKVR